MRFSEIIILSVAAGLIVSAFLILPEVLAAPGDLAMLVTTHWPALTVNWLSGYGLAAMLLTTGALPSTESLRIGTPRTMSGPAAGRGRLLRRYLISLAVVQFYTAVLALLGIGIWRLVAAGTPLSVAAISGSAGLRDGLGLILAGVLGGIAVAAAAARRRRDDGAPTAAGTAAGTAELRLLQQIDQLLSAQPSAASEREERARVVAAIEASQRPVLEATKSLTTAVNRLGRGLRRTLGEIKDAMPPQGEAWRGPGAGAPSSTDGATAELWAAVGALSESIARLNDLAPPASAGQQDLPASLAQLSSELDELLLEIDRDWPEDEARS